jgi:hypothetical protein
MPIVAVLAVLAAFAVEPADASAARSLKFRSLGSAASHVATDGRRYGAVETLEGATRVFDTRLGGAYVARPPAGCRMTGLGGGQLVYHCVDPRSGEVVPRLLDLRTGRIRLPAGLDALRRAGADQFLDVGARWLFAIHSEQSGTQEFYLDWRSGELREDPISSDRQIADLDARSLVRRLCSPLRVREASPGGSNLAIAGVFDVEGPWAQRWVEREDGFTLQLQRCGRRNRSIVRCGDRPTTACFGGQLASGLLSWTAGGRAWVLRYARGTRYRAARAFRPARGFPVVEVRHTARRVFVSVPTRRREGAYNNHEWQSYVARLR